MKDESAAVPPPEQGTGPAGDQVTDPATQRTLVTRRRWVRQPRGAGYGVTAVLVATALVGTTAYTQLPGVESSLTTDVERRLAARDLGTVEVSVEGRTVTADVLTGEDTAKVERAILSVSGVAGVETTQTYDSVKQRTTCRALERELFRATDGQRIPFVKETVRLTREGSAMVRAAARVLDGCPLGDVVVGGHADDDTPDGAMLSLKRARRMVDLLERAGVAADRLEARGYGDEFPVDDADTAQARQRNQRGEISAEGS